MMIWSDGYDGSGGKTKGSYDEQTVTLNADVKAILGIAYLVVPTAQTVNEAGRPEMRINSSDLGVSNEKFVLGEAGVGDPIATNDNAFNVMAGFIPWGASLTPRPHSKITIGISSTVTMTADWDYAWTVVYADQEPDAILAAALMAGSHVRCRGGNNLLTTVSAATWANLGTISIPSYANELVGIIPSVDMQDETAGEAVAGMIELVAPSVKNFQPQKWIFGNGFAASLGTPDSPTGNAKSRIHGTSFDLPGVNFDVTVNAILAVAVQNAVRLNVDLRYR